MLNPPRALTEEDLGNFNPDRAQNSNSDSSQREKGDTAEKG
jgi:hypothetical protein